MILLLSTLSKAMAAHQSCETLNWIHSPMKETWKSDESDWLNRCSVLCMSLPLVDLKELNKAAVILTNILSK